MNTANRALSIQKTRRCCTGWPYGSCASACLIDSTTPKNGSIIPLIPPGAGSGESRAPASTSSTAPKYLIRDRDRVYGPEVQRVAHHLGFEEIRTSPQSPWQNPYAERLTSGSPRGARSHDRWSLRRRTRSSRPHRSVDLRKGADRPQMRFLVRTGECETLALHNR
jgi:hypothetical protein